MQHHSASRMPPLLIDEHGEALLRAHAQRALARAPDVARRLLDEIDRADIVRTGALPDDVVALGSFVTYKDESSGTVQTIQLVAPQAAAPSERRITVVSPVGAALIGLAAGQRIECHVAPGRSMVLQVLRVARQETAA